MPPRVVPRHRLHPLRVALLATLAVALVAASGALAQQPSKRVAKEAENPTVGHTVLVTLQGRTLYSLSAETGGRFVCTGNCLSTWKPLTVAKGVRPKGPVKLGTEKRPDGRTQVTYKGLPLYSFDGDVKAGDANGEGLKDVGTWHAARVGSVSSAPPEPESPYPY
jgi:predicted lipoprotein with Yx(FWY)xxD motif